LKTEKNILIAFILNFFFSIFEFFGGIFTNSVALISDAIHDLTDSLSIGLSFFLEKKSKKKPDKKYTYGYLRYSVLGGLITNVILFLASTFVIFEAIKRILNPVEINYNGMILFALFGVIINLLAEHFTRSGNSLNQKSINLHMLEDVLGWLVVLIGSILMKFTDISVIDPILSIGVSLYILMHVIKNFKSILNLFLEKIPENISIDEIKKSIMAIKNIKDIHHIHIRSIDGIKNCATMHVVIDKSSDKNIKKKIKDKLKKFNIDHATIELEEEFEYCENKNC